MGRAVLMSRADRAADMLDREFGRLVVVEVAGKNAQGKLLYNTLCSCGRPKFNVLGTELRSGQVQSCGCLRTEQARINGANSGMHWLGKPFKARYFLKMLSPCSDQACPVCATTSHLVPA